MQAFPGSNSIICATVDNHQMNFPNLYHICSPSPSWPWALKKKIQIIFSQNKHPSQISLTNFLLNERQIVNIESANFYEKLGSLSKAFRVNCLVKHDE